MTPTTNTTRQRSPRGQRDSATNQHQHGDDGHADRDHGGDARRQPADQHGDRDAEGDEQYQARTAPYPPTRGPSSTRTIKPSFTVALTPDGLGQSLDTW